MKHIRGLLILLLAAALLSGCYDDGVPVAGGAATTPAQTVSLPTNSPTSKLILPTATPSPTPQPEPPAPYVFPMAPTGLFKSQGMPDDFSSPFYISEDGHMFLYTTKDNRVLKALWGGMGYTIIPVAEGVAVDPTMNVFVNENETELFCQGSKLYGKDRTGPTVVMVDLGNGARCNLDEYVAWKEQGYTISGDFQYSAGRVLSRLDEEKNGEFIPVDKWAIIDIAARTYSVLDLTGFRAANLPDWQDMKALKLALTGQGRLLAICTVHNPIIKTIETPVTTGTPKATAIPLPPVGCYAFEMDLSGHVSKGVVLVASGEQSAGCAISDGVLFNVSPDGKYLLYSAGKTPTGIFVYDMAGNKESVILQGGVPSRVFAQWGKNGSFYYGAAQKPFNNDIMLHKTSVSEIASQK